MAKLSKKTKAARKKPGGSNVGKYKGVKSFCGPAGGAPAGSFPTDIEGEKNFTITREHLDLALKNFPEIKDKVEIFVDWMKIISKPQYRILIFY